MNQLLADCFIERFEIELDSNPTRTGSQFGRRLTNAKSANCVHAPSEREIGRQLVYSEPTADKNALRLIASPGPGVNGWIEGLRSPWKGGYLRENGGGLAACLYCAIEGLISQLPPGTKPAIRRLLIRE